MPGEKSGSELTKHGTRMKDSDEAWAETQKRGKQEAEVDFMSYQNLRESLPHKFRGYVRGLMKGAIELPDGKKELKEILLKLAYIIEMPGTHTAQETKDYQDNLFPKDNKEVGLKWYKTLTVYQEINDLINQRDFKGLEKFLTSEKYGQVLDNLVYQSHASIGYINDLKEKFKSANKNQKENEKLDKMAA